MTVLVDPAPVLVAEVVEEEVVTREERRAAAAPQFRFTLHFSVSLHVISPLTAHGSATDRILVATATLLPASLVE